MRDVLVLGGGVGGLTGALELKRLGLSPVVLEKEEDLGGKVRFYCCKGTDSCNKCFVCVGDKFIREFKSSGIPYYTQVEIDYISSLDGFLVVEFLGRKKGKAFVREKMRFPAMMLAVGFTPFRAEVFKKEYGYGLWKGVVTGYDLERILRERGDVGEDKKIIAFIQCVGSRDRTLNKVYCSKVCCAYALRMADVLLQNDPTREIHFFYMDVQPLWKDFEWFYEKLKDKVKFHRALPSKVYGYRDGGISMYVEEDGEVKEKFFDLVVLSVGISPAEDLEVLSQSLGMRRNFWGFVSHTPENVFPVGCTTAPMDIMATIQSAKDAALKIARFMEGSNG